MNVFELCAKLRLDTKEYEENLKGTENKTSTFADTVKGILTADLVKNATQGFIQLGKNAIKAYADYEQLTGGVEKIFGNSSKIIEKYANEAYKTAGLSANDYMETITSFSSSLIQGLNGDTEEAAKIANRAIIDMSDNANTFGTDIGSIQSAYQGFAKQNYTMLDNLKIGYGGTKEEMERLILDASRMTKEQKELNVQVIAGKLSFDNIANAISVVQKNMNIAGTTQKEASKTISGSIGAMQAAWKNVLVSIADDNADFSKSVKQFLDTIFGEVNKNGDRVGGVVANLKPRIKTAIKGIAEIIGEGIKAFGDVVPALKPLTEVLGFLAKHIDDVGGTILALAVTLKAGEKAMVAYEATTKLVAKAKELYAQKATIAAAAQKAFNLVMDASPIMLIVTAIGLLVTAFITLWNTSEDFRKFWINLWDGIVKLFTEVPKKIADVFTDIVRKIASWGSEIKNKALEAGSAFINSISTWMKQLPAKISEKTSEATATTKKWVEDLKTKASEFGTGFVEKVVSFAATLPSKMKTELNNADNNVRTWITDLKNRAKEAGEGFNKSFITDNMANVPTKIRSVFDNVIANTKSFYATWIEDKTSGIKEKAKQAFASFVEGVKDFPKSASDKFTEVIKNTIDFFSKWIDDKTNGVGVKVQEFVRDFVDGLQDLPKEMLAIGKTILSKVWEGIKLSIKDFTDNVKKLAQDVVTNIKNTVTGAGTQQSAYGTTYYHSVAATPETFSTNTQSGITQVINVYDRNQTPDELARAIRVESKYGLMVGAY